ncbi:MAG: DUF2474 family protein [Geminicoccaceae bacterium]|nr:DUF2474 family protein [Geminicoccaceae bacterium]
MNGTGEGERSPWPRRLAWFAGLWLAGVLALAAVAGLLRALFAP